MREKKNGRRSRIPDGADLSSQAGTLLSKVETLISEARRVGRQVQQLVQAVSESGEGGDLPALPPADSEGCRPALETVQVVLARKIIQARKRAGLTQAQLAQRAGVRTETISRLESGKHAPNIRTVDRIDAALKAAGV